MPNRRECRILSIKIFVPFQCNTEMDLDIYVPGKQPLILRGNHTNVNEKKTSIIGAGSIPAMKDLYLRNFSQLFPS